MNEQSNKARGRCYAVVDLSAIDKNLAALSERIPDGVLRMAVVKANAYGHGAVAVATHIQPRVDYFAVATADEARELRAGGITKPILVLSYVTPEDYPSMAELGITLPVSEIAEARELSRVACGLRRRVKIHVPVDTGMGRIGVYPDAEGASRVARIAAMSSLDLEGVFSHFALADAADKGSAEEQLERMLHFLDMLRAEGVRPSVSHISNSAATAEMDCHLGMCRLGISLYGLYPSEESDRGVLSLTPAMSLYSRVIQVKEVPQGYGVGYGHKYVAPSRRTVATVSAGYADGYPRTLGCVGEVLVHGRRAPVLGRVCMDMIMVDVTDITGVTVGDRVTLMGRDGDEEITAEEIAERSGSFHYEILCRPSGRVPRLYIKGDDE